MENKSNNNVIIFVIVLFSVLALCVTAVFIKLLNESKKGNIFDKENYTLEKVYDEEFTDEFKLIDINVEVADVDIKVSEDDKTYVKIYNYEELTDVKVSTDTIEITAKTKKCFMFCNNKGGKVEVYLPVDYSNDLKVKSDVGDINIEGFKNAYLEVDTNVGDLEVDKIKNVIAKSDVGDIKIDNIYEYVKIKTNVGDVRIENLNIIKDSEIDSEIGDVKIENINDIYVDAKASVGETKVNKNNRKSDITLKITSSVGDIKVG